MLGVEDWEGESYVGLASHQGAVELLLGCFVLKEYCHDILVSLRKTEKVSHTNNRLVLLQKTMLLH